MSLLKDDDQLVIELKTIADILTVVLNLLLIHLVRLLLCILLEHTDYLQLLSLPLGSTGLQRILNHPKVLVLMEFHPS